MADYQNGKVYLIFIDGMREQGYVGSTIIPLSDRLRAHRTSANSNSQYKFASCVFFQEGNDVKIELLEAYPCNSKQELLIRERYWFEQYPDRINKNPPILGDEERRERENACQLRCYYNNKDHRQANSKAWKEANKEQQRLYNKQKKAEKVICETCNKEITRGALPNHRKTHLVVE